MRGPGGTRDALGVWVLSRLALLVVTAAGAWTVRRTVSGAVPSLTTAWDRWDVGLFIKVARFGYESPAYPDHDTYAFFPGLPLLLRAAHLAVPDWVLAGLLVSLVAGGVACVALARLAGQDGGPLAGRRAVLYLVLAPYAVFLAAGYSEALFLGLALPAWLAGRRGDWRTAGVLTALASSVRVTGVFLAVGLAVEYVVSRRRAGRPAVSWSAGWLAVPALPLLAYAAWLHARTGDWQAWQHAEARSWYRSFTDPLTSLRVTLRGVGEPGGPASYVWAYVADIVSMAVGVGLVVVLAVRRRWGEAVYVGLSVAALATSSFYQSVSRAALLWFPLYLLLARWGLRRGWVHQALLWLGAPLMVTGVLAFTAGQWVS